MVVLSGSFSCCWLPLEVTVPCIHSPLTVHCCLTALVPRSHELQRAGNHLWGQRETSQHLKAVGIGLPNSLLTPEGAVMFQLLSELDGVGLCLQIWYRGKPLKFRTPLFITQSPVLYEMETLLSWMWTWCWKSYCASEILCRQAIHRLESQLACGKASCVLSVWDLGWLPICAAEISKAENSEDSPASIPREKDVLSTGWKSGFGGF